MKESIEYYYNIFLDEVNEGNNCYSFLLNGSYYLLTKYLRTKEELDDILRVTEELLNKNITSFNIMLNKKREYITKIDEELYVLLKLSNNYSDEVDILEMNDYNKKTKLNEDSINKYKNNWGDLWSKKIDYFEYQINQKGINKKVILDSFSYYIGLAENAITIVNKMNKENDYGKNDFVCLQHRRIFYPNIVLNYSNPLSYIFDLSIRDVSEYIKSCFFVDSFNEAFLELSLYLKSIRLSSYSYQMLFARLLYPSYYFDIYEDVIMEEKEEDTLLHVIKRVDEYEIFLKKVYLELSKYTKLINIDWLIK